MVGFYLQLVLSGKAPTDKPNLLGNSQSSQGDREAQGPQSPFSMDLAVRDDLSLGTSLEAERTCKQDVKTLTGCGVNNQSGVSVP